jgi:acylphosphatase
MKSKMHIIVKGLVQGVFFRQFTKEWAEELNIKGWVRNLETGEVEVVCEGEEEKLSKFVEKLKIGPPSAQVEKVEVEKKEYKGEFKGFWIKYY